MFIHDLEFIESGKELSISSSTVEGGASSNASVSAYASGSESIGVTSYANASGTYTRTGTARNATIINRGETPYGYGGYTAGYANGYALGYALDRYQPPVIAFASDGASI